MKTGATLFVVVIALAAGGFAGYRLAQPKTDAAAPSVAVDSKKTAKNLLYYRNPMGLPDTSPVTLILDPMAICTLPWEMAALEAIPATDLKIQKNV